MSFILGSNSAPVHVASTQSTHKRSASISSTTSVSSTISTSSSVSSNSGSSLRERRGVAFHLALDGKLSSGETLTLKSPTFDNTPRSTRALPTPSSVFDHEATMGKVGVKSSRLRDFGMGEDGWTVVLQ